MGFSPSQYSNHPYGCVCGCGTAPPPYGDVDIGYGWSAAYPINVLIASGTAKAKGLSNVPDPISAMNLSKVSDLLARLPFRFASSISGYRSPEVNSAVGGAKKSAHMEGRAADVHPEDASNRQVAAWLYANRESFPELDQVIWYQDTGHVHIGIGGSRRAYNNLSNGFMMGRKEGSDYENWTPTAQDLAVVSRSGLKPKSAVPRLLAKLAFAGIILGTGVLAASTLGGAAILTYFRRR